MSDEKLVALPGCRVQLPGEPDADLVAVLEYLLERARQGHVRGLAYATVNDHGHVSTGWNGGAGTRWALGTGIGMLNVRYHQALVGQGS